MTDLLKNFVFAIAQDCATPERYQVKIERLEEARSKVMDAKVALEAATGYGRQVAELKDVYFELNERISELQIVINKAKAADSEGIWT